MKKFSSTTRGSSRRTSQNKKIKTILIVSVICMSLLFFIPKIVLITASAFVTPVNAVKSWLLESKDSFPQFVRDRNALAKEIENLRAELASERSTHFTERALRKENERLRNLLHDTDEERILAGIIGRPNMLPYDVLLIDKGEKDGIKRGAPVFINKDTVIGIVKEVTPHSAFVELVTTDGFQTTVFIIGPDIYTNAVGIGGGQLQVSVPQGIELKEGDLVILPSAAPGIFGQVSVVQSEPSLPEQYGYVSPDIPIASLRFVTISMRPLETVSFQDAQKVVSEAIDVFTIDVPDDVLVGTKGTSTATSTDESEIELENNHEE